MRKQNKRIALIDDDPIFNLIHAKLITSSSGFQVIEYTNAKHALKQFNSWSVTMPQLLPDIIFLDINMPDLDGWEFLEAFHKSTAALKKCKVFLLTSAENNFGLEKSKHHQSVYDFINKPLTPEMLNALL